MSELKLQLKTPEGFSFKKTVFSHGWFNLPPFQWDTARQSLTCAFELNRGRVVEATMTCRGGSRPRVEVSVAGRGRLGTRVEEQVSAVVSRILALEEDLAPFYALTDRVNRPDLSRLREAGAGRFLRSSSTWEDLVKILCTTNCSWSLTRSMVTRIVDHLGPAAASGRRAFPGPEAMAAKAPGFYRKTVKAGYRSESLAVLARRVARTEINLSSWNIPERGAGPVRDEILSLKGAGPYVADNLLRLLGDHAGLGLDSWCRQEFRRIHAGGRPVSDGRIERYYRLFGPYKGLALWCDLTQAWLDPDGPISKIAG